MTTHHWSPPSEKELAKFGGTKTLEDYPEPVLDVWEENWDVMMLYVRNQTQWRASANQLIGLDYNALYTDMALREIPTERQNELMDDIRIIEVQARKENQ